MGYYAMNVLPYFTPIILTALAVVLVITLRWFSYKERMALIEQGQFSKIGQNSKKGQTHKNLLAAGLILGLLGLALTIGLMTIGIGPWLLAGLLMLFTGLALILVSLVLAPPKPKESKPEPETMPKEISEKFEDEEQEEPSPEAFEIEEGEKQNVI